MLVFVCAALVSFLGSLQLGPVNVSVIDATLNQSRKVAILIGLGGSIPEFLYCFLAVYSGSFFVSQPTLAVYFRLALIALMLLLFVIYFSKKNTLIHIEQKAISGQKLPALKGFLKGLALCMFNPQLLPFWVFVQVYFNSHSVLKLDTTARYMWFVLGSGAGAFLLHFLLVFTVLRYKNRIASLVNHRHYNKLLAFIFLGIALQQAYQFL